MRPHSSGRGKTRRVTAYMSASITMYAPTSASPAPTSFSGGTSSTFSNTLQAAAAAVTGKLNSVRPTLPTATDKTRKSA